MTFRGARGARARGGRILPLLLVLAAVSIGATSEALAIDCVADAQGVIDGFVNYPVAPPQINIDGPCTIRNYTASNPLTSNISWFGNNPTSWLLIFNNVVHTGNMSCNLPSQGNRIWFVNSASSTVQEHCLSLLIPVEKIDKANPPGPPFVTIGVPFTWTMTIPVLWDPGTGIVIDDQGSQNDLHGITVWDDLSAAALGVDLTFLSYDAHWEDGSPIPHSFNETNGFLTFEFAPLVVPQGEQFVIEITAVLEDTPLNFPNKTFFNTATWDFGRLIEGVFYEPLPGESGISPPLTIAAPELILDKSGPATMNLGQWGDFAIDVHNTGLTPAWDVTLRDVLPDGPTGGMCDIAPEILSAQVFAADGVTPVPGKGPLNPGSDYVPTWTGSPTCRLDIAMLSASAAIGPDERLVVRYRTQLDADTDDGVALTNFAAAIEWFNDNDPNADRVSYTRPLTDGTPSLADWQDAHTVNVDLTGFFFEKTVANLTSGANPATTAAPGDALRYTLRFRTTDQAINNFRIFDELDALNAQASFVPGTLTLVTYPPTANIANTSSTGGARGTGLLDIRNLNLPVDGELVIEFDITLANALANGTVVANQSALRLPNGNLVALSDDPNVNGIADPDIQGDEDPTRLTIAASPSFRVQKISTDLTGDPAVLLAGETLRYTITVKNVGNGDATNVILRDAVPVNTTYVAGSTTLNGAPVADVGGLSPLVNGMPIHSPADPTPGSMPADASSDPSNVATITFDVVVDPSVVDGTVISNQGFVSAVPNGVVDVPSDDPDTPIANDPTRDVVGNAPLLYAEKRVVLLPSGDFGSPGIVDPGDTLRYTITVQNSAAIPATGVVLRDSVPANTTYVTNSTFLNGDPVGQPDGGASPLAAGIDISSSDLTPPLPGPGAGTISPGETAVLQFDLLVDLGTPAGTLISNQAVVTSTELPDLLTDGDGNPATGPEPTVVVVGAGQQLSISKQVTVVGGGAALPGSTLEYVVLVQNIAAVPAFSVVITDTLPVGQLAYVNGSATMNGAAAGVSVVGSTITADYNAVNGPLDPAETVVLRFRATLDPGLTSGTLVTNTGVVTWNTPTQTASASATIVVGAIPGVSVLNGSAWHDADFDNTRDTGERPLAGWTVELSQGGVLVHSTLTDANGVYRIIGVPPNDVTGSLPYELRFVAPGAGATTAMLGQAASPFTNGMQLIEDIVVPPDANLQGLNLPIDPNGVVYNSLSRAPVGGVMLTLLDGGGSPLPSGCFDDPAQQGQVTLAGGFYKFDVNFSDTAACPSGADYVIAVAPPSGTGYVTGYSQIIPPMTTPTMTPFSVPACPSNGGDAIPGTTQYCEIQTSELAPSPLIAPRTPGTNHHVHVMLDDTQVPGTSQIFNNHIPVDPQVLGSVAISKTTPLLNVTRGQLVPYTITLNNVSGELLSDLSLVDRFPPGFSYVEGSAQIDGIPTEPAVAGRELTFGGLVLAGTQVSTVKLLLAVGAGVTEGEYTNRAQVMLGVTGNPLSGEATATVRVVRDPTLDCTDVTGKVWNDANRNGRQDEGEGGLAGVRVVTARGLAATTDPYGRYHITCAITPHESRGSNFVLKLDDRTLPSGFRMSTAPVAVQRATRGKALRVNFGASIHRVVAIDLSDPAFEPGSTEIRVQWRSRIDVLLEELRKSPAVLRLSYVADTEAEDLVERRVAAVKRQVSEAWDEALYALTIEPEIFWRRGAPPKQPAVREQDGR